MTPVDTTIRAGRTLGAALGELRGKELKSEVIYFYVLDEDDKLIGVVPTRRLLLSSLDLRIRDVMISPVLQLRDTDTLEVALEEFAMHRLLALPVTDAQGKFLGVIDVRLYAEEVFDLASGRGTDDVFQFIGLSLDRARQSTAFAGFRYRIPWLACNMLSGVACAIIAAIFQEALAAVVLLAMFIPLVLTLSESISMQAMTIALQFLHRKGVAWRAVRLRAKLEWGTAALLGIACGVVVGLASIFWGGMSVPATGIAPPAVVLTVAIVLSMAASAMTGLGMPILLHAWKLDPKVAAGPVVLMICDVVTTTVYLGLATWLLV